MSTPEALEAGPRRGPFVAPRSIAWLRLLVGVAGSVAATVALALNVTDPLGWLEVGLLTLASMSMTLDRVDAQVFTRAALWGALSIGAWGTAFEPSGASIPLLCGSAIALLALGNAGFDHSGGGFAPRVLRRSLLTMMVVGLCVAHVFAIAGLAAALDPPGDFMVFEPPVIRPAVFFVNVAALMSPVALIVGVLGLSRTKSWGLFSFLFGIAACGIVVLLALFGDLPGWGYIPPSLIYGAIWGLGGALLLLVSLPVISALVFRRAPASPGRPFGQYVHAALVFAVVVGAFTKGAQLI